MRGRCICTIELRALERTLTCRLFMSSTWRVRRSVASSQKSPYNFDDIGCQSANSTADDVFQEFKSEFIPYSSFYVLKDYPYVYTCPDLWSNCNRVQKFILTLLDCLLVLLLRLWMVLVWPCNRFTRCLILIFEINHLTFLINKRRNTLKYKLTDETMGSFSLHQKLHV